MARTNDFNMTVKDLMDYIYDNRVPRNAKVIYRRIEDKYFDGIDISGMRGLDKDGAVNGIFPEGSKSKGWNTVKIKGDSYYMAKHYNEEIERGKLVIEGKLDKDEVGPYYWDDKYKSKRNPIDLNNEGILDQYVEAFTCFYDKRENSLCITAHY